MVTAVLVSVVTVFSGVSETDGGVESESGPGQLSIWTLLASPLVVAFSDAVMTSRELDVGVCLLEHSIPSRALISNRRVPCESCTIIFSDVQYN